MSGEFVRTSLRTENQHPEIMPLPFPKEHKEKHNAQSPVGFFIIIILMFAGTFVVGSVILVNWNKMTREKTFSRIFCRGTFGLQGTTTSAQDLLASVHTGDQVIGEGEYA